MSFGRATTTLTCGLGNIGGSQLAYLKVQFSGSSTLSQLIMEQDDSRDNVDWYPHNFATTTTNTSSLVNVAPVSAWQLQFASSTDGDFMADGNIMTRMFKLETPERYARVRFSLASSTNPGIRNGAFWAQIVGKDEL